MEGFCPVPVALFEILELDADDAGEGRSDQAAVQGSLGQAACEEVDVVDVGVRPPQSLDDGRSDLPAEAVEVVCPGQVADGAVEVVAGQSVVPSPLDVEGGQVQSGEGDLSLLEQVVGDFTRQKLVLILHRGRHKTTHHLKNSYLAVRKFL